MSAGGIGRTTPLNSSNFFYRMPLRAKKRSQCAFKYTTAFSKIGQTIDLTQTATRAWKARSSHPPESISED
jgi:hypothetical protein